MNEDPGSTSGPAHRKWWDRLGHLFSGEPRNREELIEELRSAQANGLMSNDTLTMVEGAIKVTELSVDDVMVPRAQIVMVSAEAPLSEIFATVVESGHSRFPVHGEDKDEILGILLAKDLLKFVGDGRDFSLATVLRPAVLIPRQRREDCRPENWCAGQDSLCSPFGQDGKQPDSDRDLQERRTERHPGPVDRDAA